jgi:site-specific DNA-cytosine methylase
MLEFLRIAHVKRPRWLVWENVPGVLSSDGGRDFGSFLGALRYLGYLEQRKLNMAHGLLMNSEKKTSSYLIIKH